MKKILSFFLLALILTTTFNIKTVKADNIYRGSYSYDLYEETRFSKRSTHAEPRHPYKKNITGSPVPDNAVIIKETSENLGYKKIDETNDYIAYAQITRVTIMYEVQSRN